MIKERWKKVRGSDIVISDSGNVIKNGKPLKPWLDTEGYKKVYINGKTERVHVLVARLFLSNPKKKPVVNHKNGNKADNRASNLEWCTYRENSLLAAKNGQIHGGNPNQPIFSEELATGMISRWRSQAEASRELKIHNSEINKALRGKRKTTHGYRFWYEEANV